MAQTQADYPSDGRFNGRGNSLVLVFGVADHLNAIPRSRDPAIPRSRDPANYARASFSFFLLAYMRSSAAVTSVMMSRVSGGTSTQPMLRPAPAGSDSSSAKRAKA